jgi:hypothetical protein
VPVVLVGRQLHEAAATAGPGEGLEPLPRIGRSPDAVVAAVQPERRQPVRAPIARERLPQAVGTAGLVDASASIAAVAARDVDGAGEAADVGGRCGDGDQPAEGLAHDEAAVGVHIGQRFRVAKDLPSLAHGRRRPVLEALGPAGARVLDVRATRDAVADARRDQHHETQ